MTTLSPLTSHHFSRPQSEFEIPSSPASDKCSPVGDTTQYYTTLHPRASEGMMHVNSPSREPEELSPHSNSSTSDSESSGGEGERDVGECIASLSGEAPVGSMVGGDGAVKHWTYEDQFKQLYNLTPEKERREFLDKLFSYMQNKGTPITRIPIMAKQPLDLYKLFKLVVERGGLVEVIKKKAWRNVAKELNLPASITSAAFTMRSQYVKYLYPYECEVAKLSSPQELQLAIESNKRDRRHSDTVDFLSPQLPRGDLEQAISPAPRPTGSNAQGLQLITSPTVAIPHGALPPYSGGFIVTGSAGAHQVVQMAHHIPGIPIVVPGSTTAAGHAQSGVVWAGKTFTDDKESTHEEREGLATPPAKKMALDMSSGMVTLGNRLPPGIGNFIVTPGPGGSMVQHPSSPQLIQMAAPGQPQIPIVIPAALPARTNGQRQESPKSIDTHQELTADTVPGHPILVRTPHHGNTPQFVTDIRPHLDSETVQRSIEAAAERSPGRNVKMPFANISIQSADGKSESGSGSSLLVTMEINNVVFQGVLFAKPQQNTGSVGHSPNSK